MLPRVFIGGTGRSGTGIFYKALGCHAAVYSLPTEMRFIIDPDGLINLLDALTINYSPVQSREALFRFENLMRVDLTTPQTPPFLSYDFDQWLGGEYYWQRLDQFCSDLQESEYLTAKVPAGLNRQERVWSRLVRKLFSSFQTRPVHRTTFNWPRSQIRLVKYFPDRSQLVALMNKFVDDLFLHAARKNGKETWCEKTPLNIFYVHFVWELFPQSVFIHVKRDPRGVVHSITNQAWGPNDVQKACLFARTMYDRWFDIRRTIDPNTQRYLEIKVEDLADSPNGVLEQVALFCGLENHFYDLPPISSDKVNYWQNTMVRQEIEQINRILGNYIEQMGYKV